MGHDICSFGPVCIEAICSADTGRCMRSYLPRQVGRQSASPSQLSTLTWKKQSLKLRFWRQRPLHTRLIWFILLDTDSSLIGIYSISSKNVVPVAPKRWFQPSLENNSSYFPKEAFLQKEMLDGMPVIQTETSMWWMGRYIHTDILIW